MNVQKFLQFYENRSKLVAELVDIRDKEIDEICNYVPKDIVEGDEITFLRNQNVAQNFVNYFEQKGRELDENALEDVETLENDGEIENETYNTSKLKQDIKSSIEKRRSSSSSAVNGFCKKNTCLSVLDEKVGLAACMEALQCSSYERRNDMIRGMKLASWNKKVGADRSDKFKHLICGVELCLKCFSFVFGLDEHTVRRIKFNSIEDAKAHDYSRVGLGTRDGTLKNIIIKFIANVASEPGNSFFAPGGRGKLPHNNVFRSVTYLHPSTTKLDVYQKFIHLAKSIPLSDHIINCGYSYFVCVWNTFIANVSISDPAGGYCKYCEEQFLVLGGRHSDELATHFQQVRVCRKLYNTQIQESVQALHASDFGCMEPNDVQLFLKNVNRTYKEVQRLPETIHISFDFAQSIQVPNHAREVQDEYFESKPKIRIFGVSNEACKFHVNYFSLEGLVPTEYKGSNVVINYLVRFFRLVQNHEHYFLLALF